MELEQAIRIATIAHTEQKEYDGFPEVLHPLRVMLKCREQYDMSEKYLVCAVLHDVIEDSDYTQDDLRQLGCDDEQLRILDLLTRKSYQETYMQYITKISCDKIATQIKLSDLADNIKRCDKITLRDRYKKAQEILKNRFE